MSPYRTSAKPAEPQPTVWQRTKRFARRHRKYAIGWFVSVAIGLGVPHVAGWQIGLVILLVAWGNFWLIAWPRYIKLRCEHGRLIIRWRRAQRCNIVQGCHCMRGHPWCAALKRRP